MTLNRTLPLFALIALLLLVLSGCADPQGGALDGDIRGAPTLSADVVNKILVDAGSPAVGLGTTLYHLSEQYQIDDAIALAFFDHESTYGKYGVARFTHSLGNIRCTPEWSSCSQGYRAYASWEQGASDWFRLISTVYVSEGRTTVAQIIPKYAPSADHNNESAYINSVLSDVGKYRNYPGISVKVRGISLRSPLLRTVEVA
jgi:hypothetical protein